MPKLIHQSYFAKKRLRRIHFGFLADQHEGERPEREEQQRHGGPTLAARRHFFRKGGNHLEKNVILRLN